MIDVTLGDGVLVFLVPLGRSAHDGDIGVGRETTWRSDTQVGIVRATRSLSERRKQEPHRRRLAPRRGRATAPRR